MANAGASLVFRLTAAPFLLLAVAYLVCALPSPEGNRGRPANIASQPFADSGTGRAKLLRPARVQMRMPKTQGLDGKSGEHAAYANLVLASAPIEIHSSVPAHFTDADAKPRPSALRTHNPRDPPHI